MSFVTEEKDKMSEEMNGEDLYEWAAENLSGRAESKLF